MKKLSYCNIYIYIYINNSLIDDEDETENIMLINQNVPVPSFLNAESSDDVLLNYCDGLKVITETRFLLD